MSINKFETTTETTADGSKKWKFNGVLHRMGAPAVEHKDGSEEWFINGESCDMEESVLFSMASVTFNKMSKEKQKEYLGKCPELITALDGDIDIDNVVISLRAEPALGKILLNRNNPEVLHAVVNIDPSLISWIKQGDIRSVINKQLAILMFEYELFDQLEELQDIEYVRKLLELRKLDRI